MKNPLKMIYPRYRDEVLEALLRPRPPDNRMNLNLVELDVLHVEAYQIKEVLKVIFPSTLVRPCRSQLVLRERHRLHPL
jgi:hypothetical protein